MYITVTIQLQPFEVHNSLTGTLSRWKLWFLNNIDGKKFCFCLFL